MFVVYRGSMRTDYMVAPGPGSLVLGELALRTARRGRVSLTSELASLGSWGGAARWCVTIGAASGGGGGGTCRPRVPDTCPNAQLQGLFPPPCGRSGPCRAVYAMKTHLSNLVVS